MITWLKNLFAKFISIKAKLKNVVSELLEKLDDIDDAIDDKNIEKVRSIVEDVRSSLKIVDHLL